VEEIVRRAIRISLLGDHLKLSCFDFLVCHGAGNRISNGDRVTIRQDEPDFEFADSDFWAPCAQDVIRDISHSTADSENVVNAEFTG
jgi:hypothetical protein